MTNRLKTLAGLLLCVGLVYFAHPLIAHARGYVASIFVTQLGVQSTPVTVAPGAIGSQACTTVTVTNVPNIFAGDTALVAIASGSASTLSLTHGIVSTTSGQLIDRVCNNSGGSITPTSGTWVFTPIHNSYP